jgi:hypothetical protein
LNERPTLPFKTRGAKEIPLQVNDVLTHPMAGLHNGQSRERWKYRYLRVIKSPTIDRPDSGRILVENAVTGKRTDFYALLFGVGFREG